MQGWVLCAGRSWIAFHFPPWPCQSQDRAARVPARHRVPTVPGRGPALLCLNYAIGGAGVGKGRRGLARNVTGGSCSQVKRYRGVISGVFSLRGNFGWPRVGCLSSCCRGFMLKTRRAPFRSPAALRECRVVAC